VTPGSGRPRRGIVMPDVDVEKLAPVLFWGVKHSPTARSSSRKNQSLYAHDAIYDRLASDLVTIAPQLQSGRNATPPMHPVGSDSEPLAVPAPAYSHRGLAHSRTSIFARRRESGSKATSSAWTLSTIPPSMHASREERFRSDSTATEVLYGRQAMESCHDSDLALVASVWACYYREGSASAERLQAAPSGSKRDSHHIAAQALAGHKHGDRCRESDSLPALEYTVPARPCPSKL